MSCYRFSLFPVAALFALFLLPLADAAEGQCEPVVHTIKNLTLYPNGTVSRSIYETRKPTGAKKQSQLSTVKVERDRLSLEPGDELVLNSDSNAVDATFHARIQLIAKSEDALGVFTSLYEVVEYNTSLFSGSPVVSEARYRVKLVSGYASHSSFLRGSKCGEVLILDESARTL